MEQSLLWKTITRSRAIDVKFEDVSYSAKTGYSKPQKRILDNLSGMFRSSEMTAIMGPSGAGKSTLLNILSGFLEGSYTGTVKYVEYNNMGNSVSHKKQKCYIQQTDSLHNFFTIYELMTFASYLKINRDISQKVRFMLIDDILNTFNLLLHRKTRVDRLSGGQKKRLSIALEMIDNPPVMFLDEPTTGLDFMASTQCISTLKSLSKAGKTIICTIHQPSAAIYLNFDHIYLMANGRCMFRSAPENTIEFFSRQGLQCPQYHNPADYIIEVVSGDYGDYRNELVTAATRLDNEPRKTVLPASEEVAASDEVMLKTNPPSEFTRLWVLLRRCAILAYRDRTTIHVKVALHFLVAVLLGLFYEHAGDDGSKTISNLSYLMVSVMYLYYTGMIPAVLKFPLEIDILRKERFNNWYQLKTYYMAALIFTIPLQIAFALIYSAISYVMSSQPLEYARFMMYLTIAILINFISEGMGLGFGAICNPVNGTFLSVITACIFLVFSGFLVLFKHMSTPMYYISYISVLRYAFEGMILSIYGNGRGKLNCPDTYCHFRVPSTIVEELNTSKTIFWVNVVILFSYLVVCRIVAYVLLKNRLSRL